MSLECPCGLVVKVQFSSVEAMVWYMTNKAPNLLKGLPSMVTNKGRKRFSGCVMVKHD